MTTPAATRPKKINFSFTRMNSFDSCAMQYEARYVRKVPELPSGPLENGRRAHTVIQSIRDHLQNQRLESAVGLKDPVTGRDFVRECVERAFVNDPETKTTEGYREVYFLALAFAKSYVHNWETCLGVEAFLSRPLGIIGDYDVTIVGYADLLYWDAGPGDPDPATFDTNKIVVSRDEKTGWDATLNASHIFQGEIYDWLLAGTFPDNEVAYEVNFSRHNIRSKRVGIQPIDLERIEARMRAIVTRALNAENLYRRQLYNPQPDEDPAHNEAAFPARPGAHCKYCSVAVRCAKRNALVREGALVDTEESAEAALADLAILQAAVKAREQHLRTWAKDFGPVRANGLGAGFWPSEGVTIDDVGALIDAVGLDAAIAEGLVRPNGDKLKTKRVQARPELADLWVPKTATRWGLKDVTEERLEIPVLDPDFGDEPQAEAES